METTALTEFDLIAVGDDAALNQDCTLQTHLFEDRVMKMSTIDVGARATAGARAVVLYDSALEPGAHLSDLSLLMKGETLPANTHWEGTPARRVAVEPPAADKSCLEPAVSLAETCAAS
jgi:non-ribosomal peptide synthetase-like protein